VLAVEGRTFGALRLGRGGDDQKREGEDRREGARGTHEDEGEGLLRRWLDK
jgi:hypothetical protein